MGRTERAAVGLAAGLLLLSACGANTPPAPLHSVTLVAKSTQTEFWLSVFAGAEAAAAEYNLELTTVGPETEEDYETQNEMIARAVEAGTEALVFSAIDFEKNVLRKLLNCANHPTNFKRHLESLLRKRLLAMDDYSFAVLTINANNK